MSSNNISIGCTGKLHVVGYEELQRCNRILNMKVNFLITVMHKVSMMYRSLCPDEVIR